VYGGTDGILSAFNFLMLLTSAHVPSHLILVVLILKLIADAISLAISNYTSVVSAREQKPDEEDLESPYISSIITLLGFLVFGAIPILIYHYLLHDNGKTFANMLVIVITLFLFGCFQGVVIYRKTVQAIRKGVYMVATGMVGILASMFIGGTLQHLVGMAL
jgi:VIT1/CCC1 family predicted Fe2+/Mn2+ transporter